MKKIIFTFLFLSLMCSWANASKWQQYYKKGMSFYQQGNFKKAISFLEKAVEEDSEFAPVYNALGLAHNALGDELSDVIWFFQVAIELDPEYADAYGNMCKIYYERGVHEKAEEACLKSISINPSMVSSKLYLAWIYLLGKDQPSTAVYYFQEVLERVENPAIYFGLGLAYCKSGETAMALDMVTTLRGMGENEFASKLEAEMRHQSPPGQPNLDSITLPVKKQDTLVGPPKAEPEEEGPKGQPLGGQMKIRLRGTLTNPPDSSKEKDHPGSL